jgi:hypothetical protein
MNHPIDARVLDWNSGCSQSPHVFLALVPRRVKLYRHDDRWRQAVQAARAQR